jgi:hypothetical protein
MVGSSDALSTERHYVATILPMGLARGLIGIASGRGKRVDNLAKSLVLMMGLAVTVAGYLCSLMRSQIPRLPVYSPLSRRRQSSAVSILPLFQSDREDLV